MPGARDCENYLDCLCSCWLCKEGHYSTMPKDHCGKHEYGCHLQCYPM